MVKTIEFESKVADDDQLRIPTEVLQPIPKGSNLHVILVLDPDDGLGPLRELAMERFAACYEEDDYDYDQLLNSPAPR